MTAATTNRAPGNARWGSKRTRLLAGAFLLVFCAWAMDTLGQERGPKTAAAQTSPTAGAFIIADPTDRSALDRFLADQEPRLEPLVIDDAVRDPFALPARWESARVTRPEPAESQPVDPPVASPPHGSSETREKTFADAHHLQGVILGSRPLALIDGNGYRVGDWIDGYRVVSLSRDTAELVGRGGRVILRVAAPDLKPIRSSP